jgi:hypothetical protein
MATLASPYRALAALLRTRWQQRRARQQATRQIEWGMAYIRDRYGDRHEQAYGWYNEGGQP